MQGARIKGHIRLLSQVTYLKATGVVPYNICYSSYFAFNFLILLPLTALGDLG